MNENDRSPEELSNENTAGWADQPAQFSQPDQPGEANEMGAPAQPSENNEPVQEQEISHTQCEATLASQCDMPQHNMPQYDIEHPLDEPHQNYGEFSQHDMPLAQPEMTPMQGEMAAAQAAGKYVHPENMHPENMHPENTQSAELHMNSQEATVQAPSWQTTPQPLAAPQSETASHPLAASQSETAAQPGALESPMPHMHAPNYSLPQYDAPNYGASGYADPARVATSERKTLGQEDSQNEKPYQRDPQANNSQPSQSSQPYTSQPYTSHSAKQPPAGMPTMAAPFGIPATPSAPKTKSTHRGPGWIAAIAMSVGAALVGGGIGVSASMGVRPVASSSTTQKTTRELAPVVESSGEAPNWQKVQEAVGNSVVAIDTQKSEGKASGSGVIIDKEGHVLTNEHVISGAEKIYVTLADGNVYKATIAGSDQATDLAVLTIENPPSDLTVAQLGDSSALHVGQNVAAIGNPLGLSSTMTTGIISALNRPVQTKSEPKEPQGGNDFFGGRDPFGGSDPFGEHRQQQSSSVVTNAIQIDAAVNPGNSGGPVFDSAGRVIGITSSIASLSSSSGGQSGSIGLGFAIPINLAQKIAQQLIANGVAEHAFLGVTINDGAAQYDGTTRLGAEVNSVSDGTPAAKAGIKKGDVITKIDNNSVSSATSLTGFVRQYSSGDVVTVTLERDGKLMEVQVTLATKQD